MDLKRHIEYAVKAGIAVALVLALGCGGGDPQSALTQDTPKGTMEKLFESLESRNEGQYLACFHTTDDQAKFVKVTYEFATTAMDFEEAMVKAYGADTMKAMGDSPGGFKKPNLEHVNFKIEGDKAFASSPKESMEMKLLRVGDSWYIDASDMAASDETEQAAEMMSSISNVYREVMPEIGKEGVTADDVSKKIAEKMMAVIFGGLLD